MPAGAALSVRAGVVSGAANVSGKARCAGSSTGIVILSATRERESQEIITEGLKSLLQAAVLIPQPIVRVQQRSFQGPDHEVLVPHAKEQHDGQQDVPSWELVFGHFKPAGKKL